MNKNKSGWAWVPTLYFAEGLPYVVVMTVSVIMYKNLGLSNTDIAFYTSWLYLPWVIKPLWSPFVDLVKTKRWWVTSMQTLIGVCLAGIAFTLPTTLFLQFTLAIFWLMAFSSATHDIAADGFYMLALTEQEQSLFAGIRNIFYRIASITGQGLLVFLAGLLIKRSGDVNTAWSMIFAASAALFIIIAVYHYVVLPKPESDSSRSMMKIGDLFKTFFTKKGIWLSLAFILLYRLGESQLVKIASPFLLDSREAGGLGITTDVVGVLYGTVGVIALLLGGILGGIAASRKGLKFWIWIMVAAMNLPNLVYVYLAMTQPENIYVIGSCIALEQFGYGFGFTGFMLYLILVAQGEYKTAHYALCTGFMALGMMLPGMAAGWIQENIAALAQNILPTSMGGYPLFFIWVCICTIPGFILTAMLKIPAEFGMKK
jgi:PAT family beta-lactamase induction signal transducer AmpG